MSTSNFSLKEITGRITIAAICLDMQTYMSLSQFLASQPGGGVASNLNRYLGSEREVSRSLDPGSTRVCLVDLDANPTEANQTVERLHAECPDIFVFAISASSDTEQIISAMRNGCTDFLTKPLRHEVLATALNRAEMKQRERNHKDKRGKVISLIGAKGGTGVTTLALHLSLALARESGKKCLLVDQHTALGDSSLYLGVGRHKYNFYDLVGSVERLDDELLQGFVLHHDSGLDLLDSPDLVDFSAYATPTAVSQTISFLAERHQYVVVDIPPGLSDATLATLSQSDQIAIVLTAELPALRNAVHYIEYLSKLGMNPNSLHIVLNRYSKKTALGDDKVEKTLQHAIGLRVPNCYQDVIRFINAGTPIEAGQKSDFGAAINGWCEEVIGVPTTRDAIPTNRKPQEKILSFLNRQA